MLDTDDTIVAIATPRAGSIRGIVRIAGPQTVAILSTVLQWEDAAAAGAGKYSGADRRAGPAFISAGTILREVPCEVYLWQGTRSYTRQPAAELHTFGSPPVLDAILAALCRAGARLAKPGEFTLRAFLAGRLDLTQAEAVLGVIDAGTQGELQSALQQLAGGLARPLRELREQLLEVLAHLEAGLDFVEEDIEFLSRAELDGQLRQAAQIVARLVDQMQSRTAVTGEPRVVLRGLPNVGKSSLFNALAGADRALVSPAPSTTRDYVQAPVPVGDRTVLLIDTAGIESEVSRASIMGEAQRMAAAQAQAAAIELFCLDATRPVQTDERQHLDRATATPRIIVLTKCDQPIQTDWQSPAIATSSRTASGLDRLRQALGEALDESAHAESAVVASTAVRCADSLRRAAASLARALRLVHEAAGEELVAAELRFALDDLAAVAGVVYTDDILDRIFSRFCIGK